MKKDIRIAALPIALLSIVVGIAGIASPDGGMTLRRLLFAEREFHRVKAIGTNEKPETTPPLISAIPAPQRIGRSSVSGVRMSSSPPAAA